MRTPLYDGVNNPHIYAKREENLYRQQTAICFGRKTIRKEATRKI
jgi:hypothetical protein